MTPEFLISLSTHPRFPKTARELIELIGVDAAAALVVVGEWGGTSMSIPSCRDVMRYRRAECVRADFDRLTFRGAMSSTNAVFELGITYGVTGKTIENTLKKVNHPPVEKNHV